VLEERKREREFGFVYASQSPFLKVFLVRFLDRTFIISVPIIVIVKTVHSVQTCIFNGRTSN